MAATPFKRVGSGDQYPAAFGEHRVVGGVPRHR
jgi:hypothetical protein